MNETEVSRQLAELASELSHHLNSPLTVVQANLATIERLCSDIVERRDEKQAELDLKEVLADVRTSLDRLSLVVRRMTVLSYQTQSDQTFLGAPFGKHESES